MTERQTCFRFEQGHYWCRGDSGRAQLSNELSVSIKPPSPFLHALGGPYLALDIGRTACGIKPDHTVVCWGDNVKGIVLPRPSPGSADDPGEFLKTPTPMPSLGTSLNRVSSRGTELCVLAKGEVRCAINRYPYTYERIEDLPDDIRDVKAGDGFACAGNATDVYCWGYEAWADAERPDGVSRAPGASGKRSPMRAVRIQGKAGHISDLQVGGSSGAVLTEDGRVCAFGENLYAQWGTGIQDYCEREACNKHKPRGFHCLPAFAKVTSLGYGEQFACALTDKHEVWCWGYNTLAAPGQAPRATKVPFSGGATLELFPKPIQRADLGSDNQRLLVGGSHACVEKLDRSFVCWGSNFYSQLQDPTPASSTLGTYLFPLSLPAPRCRDRRAQ